LISEPEMVNFDLIENARNTRPLPDRSDNSLA
jgi:hypothetical protein